MGAFLYSIKIEVNDTCTLACKMCYVRKAGHVLPLSCIRGLLDQVAGLGVRIELLGGEPLLREDIVEIIRYAKAEAVVPFVSLYTNGVHATGTLARDLREAGLDAAIVSLISHRPDSHDAFTGRQGSWKRTTDGIRRFREAGVRTYTFTALHADNYADLEGICSFVKNDLRAHPLFYQYVPQGKDDPLILDPADWYLARNWVLAANPDHAQFMRRYHLLTGQACAGGSYVLTVKVDGSVQPCPFVSDVPLGSIHEEGIWSIYRRRFRSARFREFRNVPAECKGCSYSSVCGGGCRAGSRTLFGSYDRKDHKCLGPYREPFDAAQVLGKTPAFF
jgi:radical SAM protein with 4Fe4S-binding SPASM domain